MPSKEILLQWDKLADHGSIDLFLKRHSAHSGPIKYDPRSRVHHSLEHAKVRGTQLPLFWDYVI